VRTDARHHPAYQGEAERRFFGLYANGEGSGARR
jgi:hypothetical protein